MVVEMELKFQVGGDSKDHALMAFILFLLLYFNIFIGV